ncbi:MAG: hypothetical protein ACXVZ2_12575 [Gaiellaceae bacterium]
MSEAPSRIEDARRRAADAKQLAVAAAAVGFLVALILARASHPGQAASSPSRSSDGSSSRSQNGSGTQLGSGYVVPYAGGDAVVTETHVS